ncbi:hypothetical protein [Streptomyces ficellus]|uniref:Lipoprotein n=1 Tax=Streptomyces ficellus TaxID=1977088 RepID=A0A6I6FGG1_9ACTN|nr:hypothetical protein [Streptomyces ficellus]QGV80227.1 hypothetical protein EIZ62_19780 [Streptomyces ficellus]
MSATTRRALKVSLVAALCTSAALGLSACGPTGTAGAKAEEKGPFPGLSGQQIANKAIKATKSATSLTLDADLTTEDGRTKTFLALDTKGQCAGTVTLGATGTMEILRTGGLAYLRFDEAFLRDQNEGSSPEETEAVLTMLKGRWVKTDIDDPEAKDSLGMCELNTLLSEFETGRNAAERGEETTVNGKKALTLTEKDGATTYKIYVATEGEPYLLKVDVKGGDEPGTMSFLDYGKPVPAKKPAEKDIVDLDALGAE